MALTYMQRRRAVPFSRYAAPAKRFRAARSASVRARRPASRVGSVGTGRFGRAAIGLRPRSVMPSSSGERKHHDLAQAFYECSTSGSIACVNLIPQGSTGITMLGARARQLQLHVRGRVSAGADGTIAAGSVLIVHDRSPKGALPAIDDILQSVNTTAFYNFDNASRFTVLARHNFTLEGKSGDPTADSIRELDFLVPYAASTGTLIGTTAAGAAAIANIEQGAVYIVTVGNVVTGTTASVATLAFRTVFVG